MGINCLPLYYYDLMFFVTYNLFISDSVLLLCIDLLNYNCTHKFGWGGSCCCCSSCYHTKVKSTPRFGLGLEFDNSEFVDIHIYYTWLLQDYSHLHTDPVCRCLFLGVSLVFVLERITSCCYFFLKVR